MHADARRSIKFILALSAFICVHPRFQTSSSAAEVNFEKRWLSGMFYGEGANFGDFNKDGKLDVVSGPYIYDGPDFKAQHEFMKPEPSDPLHYSKNFFAYTSDFNKDGFADILIIGFPGEETFWYENPGTKTGIKHWDKHLVLKVTDNESPVLANLIGPPSDDAPELVCMSGGYLGYATFVSDDQPWKFVPISPKSDAYQRFTHGLGVGDVNGDGKMDILEKSGWWEQPASLAPPDSEKTWTKHDEEFSKKGCSQMYAYDVDGDGDNDVVCALEAHGYGLAWYEQSKDVDKITFKQHLILSPKPDEKMNGIQFSQLHAVELIDMDNDGLKDILTGKRYWAHGPAGDPDPEGAPVLYWFKLTRTPAEGSNGGKDVKFEPKQIDAHSGVGTMVAAQDVNGDKRSDVLVGNKRGTMLFLSK
jgi:hypothetical protein